MKKIKLLVTLLTLTVVLLTGCGGSKNATYTAHYSMDTAKEITGSTFFPNESLVGMMATQNQIFVDYKLEVNNKKYTLTATGYSGDPDTGKAYVVGDDSSIAITVTSVATGKVLEANDTSVKIDAPESVSYSIPQDKCDSIGQQLASILTIAEADAESPCGSWTSEDKPELLKSVPATTFTVTKDGAITGWK